MPRWRRTATRPIDVPPMILILGTADWNQAIATNQHYMARELAMQFPVVFSESLGLRRPELTRRDLDRMVRRIRSKPLGAEKRRFIPAKLSVMRPIIVPLHVPATKPLNRLLLSRLYKTWVSHPGPRILWTYSPLTYGFDALADVTVYHCVDLLAEFPAISSELVRSGESALVKTADLAIASSGAVYDHLSSAGFRRVHHWPNVADVSLIQGEKNSVEHRSPGRAVFAGNFSEKKVDFDLLRQLLANGVDLQLAGPIAEGGGKAEALVKELVHQGATYRGHLSLAELARLYWTCSIGLIPYEINAYTLGVNPLKTYEYLAAGLHVVSTAIPAVEPIADHVSIATSPDDYVREVLTHLSSPSMEQETARQLIAERNSWSLRGVQARRELQDMIDGLGR